MHGCGDAITALGDEHARRPPVALDRERQRKCWPNGSVGPGRREPLKEPGARLERELTEHGQLDHDRQVCHLPILASAPDDRARRQATRFARSRSASRARPVEPPRATCNATNALVSRRPQPDSRRSSEPRAPNPLFGRSQAVALPRRISLDAPAKTLGFDYVSRHLVGRRLPALACRPKQPRTGRGAGYPSLRGSRRRALLQPRRGGLLHVASVCRALFGRRPATL